MGKQLIMLRASYWAAAIADFVVAALVLVPERMGVTEFVYPMGLMSAVAFSWGVLLLIADRKPLERKWVLAPTLLVVFLLWARSATAIHIFFPDNADYEFMDLALFLGIGTTVGAIFSTIVFTTSAFSLPMLMDRKTDAITAVVTSIRPIAAPNSVGNSGPRMTPVRV